MFLVWDDLHSGSRRLDLCVLSQIFEWFADYNRYVFDSNVNVKKIEDSTLIALIIFESFLKDSERN